MSPLPAVLAQPFDHEVAQLRLGLRAIVKREFARREEIARLVGAGLLVRWTDERYGVASESPEVVQGEAGPARTALLGRDGGALDRAVALDQAERRARGEVRRQAVAELGELLGYPRCCAARYAAQADGGERATFERLLQGHPWEGLPTVNNLFVLDHQLISHFPCALDCPATRALGEATLQGAAPDVRAALQSLLSAPMVVWDRFRLLVQHPDWGTLTALDLTSAARVHRHGPLHDFVRRLPTPPAGGARLCFDLPPPL